MVPCQGLTCARASTTVPSKHGAQTPRRLVLLDKGSPQTKGLVGDAWSRKKLDHLEPCNLTWNFTTLFLSSLCLYGFLCVYNIEKNNIHIYRYTCVYTYTYNIYIYILYIYIYLHVYIYIYPPMYMYVSTAAIRRRAGTSTRLWGCPGARKPSPVRRERGSFASPAGGKEADRRGAGGAWEADP